MAVFFPEVAGALGGEKVSRCQAVHALGPSDQGAPWCAIAPGGLGKPEGSL